MYQKSLIETVKSLLTAPVVVLQKDSLGRTEIELKLKELKNKNLRNIFTNITAQINTKQKNKFLSNRAVEKSISNGFTRQQHYAVASEIEKIFKKATIIVRRKDRENDINIKWIKSFIVPFKFYAKEDTNYASILIKETKEHGNKIYTIELQQLMNVEKMLEEYFN